MKTLPTGSLSLDLDNQWSYMKTHGDAGWESFPTYLDTVVPRVNELLGSLDLKLTYFIVGQDAALAGNREALQLIPAAGHEVGNHSFHHEPWLHRYDENEVTAEVARAEDAIADAAGVRPNGWRGPGFSCSPTVLKVLARRGYAYDASTFPTYLGPLARAYYFMTSKRKFTAEERAERGQLFGTFSEGRRPLKPYRWGDGGEGLLEIPVTTMPILRVPFHVSYLLYLASFSKLAAKLYFTNVLRLCRLTRTPVSLLLHPLDFMDGEDAPPLKFFPAMRTPHAEKLELVSGFLKQFQKRYDVVPMGEHARRLNNPERAAELRVAKAY
jgi:hypothetical protein